VKEDLETHRSEEARRVRSQDLLTFGEIERVGRIFADMGVTKIRLTGGEPLVRKDVPALIARLARIPGINSVGITTNGVLLQQHVPALKEAGLTHLNISLDSLQSDRFQRIAMRPSHDKVLAGLAEALAAGFQSIKLNVVVMGGVNDDELPEFVRLTQETPIEVRFIEYMPFKFNRWNTASFVSFANMKHQIEEHVTLVPIEEQDNEPTVARRYRVPGWTGTVGFIASMSEHFCGSCNRIRVTADGSIKSCLFHPAEVNLRIALREGMSNPTIEEMIRDAVRLKPEGHAPVEELVHMENRTMIQIGG
jgi:cyclic pyranopterin phosphate synthase